MSSTLERAEHFLATAGFDRAPWLAVGFGGGIAAWFALPHAWQWLALVAACAVLAGAVLIVLHRDGRLPYLRQAVAALALAVAAGCGTVWTKSALVGTPGLDRPLAATVAGMVLSREEQPADGRTRLVLAMRAPGGPGEAGLPADRVVRVRLNVPARFDDPAASEGAMVRLKGRLIPPAPPMLPGSYDFARAAWFTGLAATGTATGPVQVITPAPGQHLLPQMRRGLSRHIHLQLAGSPGGIAAAFASGDRGAIAEADEAAMRDSGLTHLLSVSGLHVSAVIGATYLIVLRLLALWPWVALRLRLPLVAAGAAALAGIGYTVLTGAEVPTVRSVAGALLVLVAVALGREPLSLRLLAAAGFAVMLAWPEAVVGPSFQLSFAAVLTIVALHQAGWMRHFAARREEPWWLAGARHLAVILLTGVAIELALLPIGLYHFHRAGVYGALANVIAIPLTTFVTMPLIALALVMDLGGAGWPAWWAVGQSLELLLALARIVAAQPGAVTTLPAMGGASYALFLAGGLWLALWSGRARLLGLVPVAAGTAWLAMLSPPDVLVSGDGHHVGFARLVPGKLVVLRETRSDFAREKLAELAGMDGDVVPLETWPGARCNADFCALTIARGGRSWRLLLARGSAPVPMRDLAAACERADIVVADRWLPRSCRPAVLKLDRAMLAQSGGVALDLDHGRMTTVAASQGDHGWWRPPPARPAWNRPGPSQPEGPATTPATAQSAAQATAPATAQAQAAGTASPRQPAP
ncbi:ComEC/Rec2 family competence protein [Novosphingobium bradum]|uniref:ComEC/Rec2 family competence protein n=1 Tax=Novosphingobium bradum TaxID=1737444 RepID=A0ABV7ITW2_9SPHN